MHTHILFSLLLSPLIAAQGTITLLVGLETSGDAATTLSIPFRQLSEEIRPAASLQVRTANVIPIPIEQVVCQAYNNSAGTNKIGEPFDQDRAVVLAQGGEDLRVSWVYCSDAAGVAAFRGRPTAQPAQVQEVRIQLNFEGEGAAQGSVPVNGRITPTRGLFATRVANSGAIIAGADGQQPVTVDCEVFGDAAGGNRIAVLRGSGEAVIFARGGRDVGVGAFSCANSS